MNLPATLFVACAAAFLAAAPPASAGDVTINVSDQNSLGYSQGASNDGQGSTVNISGGPTIRSGQSANLAPGTYTMTVWPFPALYRSFQNVEVTAATTEINLVWESRTVALRFVDQHGALLPGLTAALPYHPGVANGGSVRVPINDSSYYADLGYSPDDYRVDGTVAGGQLMRNVQGNVVGPTTTQLEHEWQTVDFTLRMVDQHGADITQYNGGIGVSWMGSGPSPLTLTLPVNDTSFYPDLNAYVPFANHYEYSMRPFEGNGLQRGWQRWMTNPASTLLVNPSTTDLTLDWHMQDVVIHAVDQTGAPMPAINGERQTSGERAIQVVTYAYPRGVSPASLRLPVNDKTLYPSLYGSGSIDNENEADGYHLRITWDRHFTNTSMYLGQDSEFILTPTTTQFDVPWITVTGPLFVVDANGDPVAGSTFRITNPTGAGDIERASGDTVTLAVTDNATYPNLRGGFANGYPVVINPGDTAGSASYQFELMPNADLLPQQVTIDGGSYGLRFIFNASPLADAGANLTILGAEQASTTVDGVASDNDGDALTYRWLDGGGAEVQASLAVGLLGEAPLDLGGLAALALGNHTFVLEVDDGQVLSTDSMVVSVNNSPPDATTGGAITAELGADIFLTGAASDYDGDSLSWSWAEGATVLASGSVATVAGGAPVTVPPQTISGGLPLGMHALTLAVDDGVNAALSLDLLVEVIDTTAPTLAPVADTSILWPPNHQLRDVIVTLNAGDESDTIAYDVEVASSENPDTDGDGNTIPDFTAPVVDPMAGTVSMMLRSERSGKGSGRVYTITITATDSSGNATTSSVEVVCPHDRRKK